MSGIFKRRLRCLAALVAACWGSACQHESSLDAKRDPAVLDGMELTAARRVGLESAADAMQRGDLERLRMLSVWVRRRAQVVLLEPADLDALDHAVACLADSSARAKELAALQELKTGALLKPARELCGRDAEPDAAILAP
jgi:hypothetical protein